MIFSSDRNPEQSLARLQECTQLVKILLFSSNRSQILIQRLQVLSFVKQQLAGIFTTTVTDQLLTSDYYHPFSADAYTDAWLYNNGLRSDFGLYIKLYGVDPLRVQWLGMYNCFMFCMF